MKIIGLTGGIGSGKTTVAGFFADLGVPIYIADKEAKKLTNNSKVIRKKMIALLGPQAYSPEGLNNKWVANVIFKDAELLQKVNEIIHPKVGKHFRKWAAKQLYPYCIKEAAILFENGGYKHCDATILVTAPIKVRVQRVLSRDEITSQAIEERMANQWSDEEKIPLATFHIENIDLVETKDQVEKLHRRILKH